MPLTLRGASARTPEPRGGGGDSREGTGRRQKAGGGGGTAASKRPEPYLAAGAQRRARHWGPATTDVHDDARATTASLVRGTGAKASRLSMSLGSLSREATTTTAVKTESSSPPPDRAGEACAQALRSSCEQLGQGYGYERAIGGDRAHTTRSHAKQSRDRMCPMGWASPYQRGTEVGNTGPEGRRRRQVAQAQGYLRY